MEAKLLRIISLFVLLIFLVTGVSAEEKIHRIAQFGGLNTIAGDFSIKPDECRQAHNIDWGRNIGSPTKRYGYDSVSVISGQDSAVGLYGAYYSDGTQQLIVVTDSAGVGYGNVYASPKGKAHFAGSNYYVETITGAATYYYYDTIIVGSDTIAGGYTSGVDDPISLIATNLRDSLNADPDAATYFTITAPKLKIYEDAEGITIDHRHSANQSVDTTANNVSRIATYFPIIEKPSFAMHNDNLYIVNGVSSGVVFNGDVALPYPVTSPGGLRITPLLEDGPLSGEYRYAISWDISEGDTVKSRLGLITGPVRVDGGKTRIEGFPLRTKDSLFSQKDTAVVKLWRTTGDIGALDNFDSIWYTGLSVEIDSSNWRSAVIVDSISDDSLRSRDSSRFILPESDQSDGMGVRFGNRSFWYFRTFGVILDSTLVDSIAVAPGAPSFVSWDSVAGSDQGIVEGVATAGFSSATHQATAWMWVAVYGDTSINVFSDTGVACVWDAPSVSSFNVTQTFSIATPRTPDTTVVVQIYRALLGVNLGREEQDSRVPIYHIAAGPYLVSTLSPGDTLYDSLSFTDLVGERLYPGNYVPPFMGRLLSYDNHLFGTYKSNVHISLLDTAVFGGLDYISLGKDDGDQLTAIYPSRLGLTCLKNKSRWTIRQDDNGDWGRQHVNDFVGCIAPNSVAFGSMGVYYLSDEGVRRTSDGKTLDRTYDDLLISAPLANFTDLPITTLDDAEGFYFDQKYMLNIGDTTYVYDERSGSWATWSIRFADATLYGTEDELNFLPGDSMYFIKPGDSVLYRYGTSESDNGNFVSVTWRSGPQFISSPRFKVINSIELGVSDSESDDSVLVALFDEKDTQLTDITLSGGTAVFDSLANRFQRVGLLPMEPRRYFEIVMYLNGLNTNSSAVVDVMDIWYTEGMVAEID